MAIQGDLDGGVILGATKRAPVPSFGVIRDILAVRVDAFAADAESNHHILGGPLRDLGVRIWAPFFLAIGKLIAIIVFLACALMQLRFVVKTTNVVESDSHIDVRLKGSLVFRLEKGSRHARGGIDVTATSITRV
jgi:hypothetical protein